MENPSDERYDTSQFTVTPEMMDSLRMEYSCATPEENKMVEDLAYVIKEKILEDYGDHIRPDVKEKLETQETRILIVDDEGMKSFVQEWLPQSKLHVLTNEAGGYFIRVGNLVLVLDFKEIIRKEFEEKPDLYSRFTPEDKKLIEEYTKLRVFIEIITHELAHSCQQRPDEKTLRDALKRFAFDECGATYITNQIMDKSYPGRRSEDTPEIKFRNSVFSKLLEKYGDGVYDVFFHNIPENEEAKDKYEKIKQNIFTEFESEAVLAIVLDDNLYRAYRKIFTPSE